MRNVKVFLSAAICGAVFIFTQATQAQDTPQQGIATVVRIQGEARYTLGDGAWHPLVVGKVLSAGSSIQTSHNGIVDVVLGKSIEMPQAAPLPNQIDLAHDAKVTGWTSFKPAAEQNVVRLTSDTTLGIDKLTVSDTGLDTVSDTELNLKQGKIYANVKKLNRASQYLIKLPNGIAGVRGTFFSISADGTTSVYHSSVIVSLVGPDGNPQTFLVGEGNSFNPSTGQIVPLSADMLQYFSTLLPALTSVYVNQAGVAFIDDQTQVFVSPKSGHHKGGGNSGNGGGNQP